MSLRAVGKNLIVRKIAPPETTLPSGLVLPQRATESDNGTFEVVSVGEQVTFRDSISVDDTIYVNGSSDPGFRLRHNGEELYCIHEHLVSAVFTK